jgi:hypothetical protein
MEELDHAVEATGNQIENVSGTVKSAVLRPVREVNGMPPASRPPFAHWCVLSTRVSVDSATKDE